MTVSLTAGHGSAVLPTGYVQAHVRLGYAATEHGVQGDTLAADIELATPATTRRGLYVALTRGQQHNLVLVVTESHDTTEARDILEGILANDRVDVPATTQRRTLAGTDRSPQRPRSLQPRCTIPDWFPTLRVAIGKELSTVEHRAVEHEQRRADLTGHLAHAKRELAIAEQELDPYRPMLAAAHADVRATQERIWAANNTAGRTKGRAKRHAEHDARVARTDHANAVSRQHDVGALTAPARDAAHAAATKVQQIETSIRVHEVFDRWDNPHARADQLRDLAVAVGDWHRWAAGKPFSGDRTIAMTTPLRSDLASQIPGCEQLTVAVDQWTSANGVQPAQREVAASRHPVELGL